MKTKLSLLAVLPVLMLASCGKGAEIKDQNKIDEIKTNIANKAKDIKCYEMTFKSESTEYDDEQKKNVTTKTDMLYRTNDKGEAYMKSSGTSDGEKNESTVYLVNNEKYKQVLYTSTYDPETQKDEIAVYGYEGNELTFSFSALYFIIPQAYSSMFIDPTEIDFAELDEAEQSTVKYDTDVKYYSSGDENLTVEAKIKAKGEIDKAAEEYPVSYNYTIQYDKGYFKSAKIEGTSNKDNKSAIDIAFSVKDSVSIELPAGWEELINQSSSGFDF